jgi:hypothetical protein
MNEQRKLLIGLIGAGIQKSLSPRMHEEEARHHGMRLFYQLIDLDAAKSSVEELPTLIRAARIMNFAGLNITYPCKQAVIPLLDDHPMRRRSAPSTPWSCATASGSVTTPTGGALQRISAATWPMRRVAAWCSLAPAVPGQPWPTR